MERGARRGRKGAGRQAAVVATVETAGVAPIEGPWELPEGWRWKRLADVVQPIKRGAPSSLGRGLFRYVDVSGVSGSRIVPREVAAADAPGRARQFLRGGDTIVSTARVYLKNVAFVASDDEADVASTAFCVLRPSDNVCPRYLFHYVASDRFIHSLLPLQRGNSPPAVLDDDIKAQVIPLPSKKAQERIAAKIDALFADVDEAEAALDDVSQGLEAYRRSILKAAVTGELTRAWRETHPLKETGTDLLNQIQNDRRKHRDDDRAGRDSGNVEASLPNFASLPELPKGWIWASMGDLFRVFVGATPPRDSPDAWAGDMPWVSSGEVAFCEITSTRETISPRTLAASRIHPPGTVLLGMIGEGRTRGQAAILRIAAAHNQNAASIRVSETPIPPEYVYDYLFYRYEKTRKAGAGGNQPALNKQRVQAIELPLPPLAELLEIVRTVKASLGQSSEVSEILSMMREHPSDVRQAVLRAAFRGELIQ